MKETWLSKVTEISQGRRLFEEERLILEATDRICAMMEEEGVSRADLAAALDTSRANVTQLLDGSRNMTLRTLAGLAHVLGYRACVQLEPLRDQAFIGTPVKIMGVAKPRNVAHLAATELAAEPVDETMKLAG